MSGASKQKIPRNASAQSAESFVEINAADVIDTSLETSAPSKSPEMAELASNTDDALHQVPLDDETLVTELPLSENVETKQGIVAASTDSATQNAASAEHAEAVVAPVSETDIGVSSPTAVSVAPATAQQANFEPLREFEATASKVAAEVQHVAHDLSKKFSASFASLGGTRGGAAATPAASLKALAGGISNWWSSLDPAPAPKPADEISVKVSSASMASGETAALFGLQGDEHVVESFSCKLLQTYGCNHNSFTPPLQMAFTGQLHITDRHTCFVVEERGRRVPFKIAHADVLAAQHSGPKKGEKGDVLRIDMRSNEWVAFKDFATIADLDAALALIEHLAADAAAVKP